MPEPSKGYQDSRTSQCQMPVSSSCCAIVATPHWSSSGKSRKIITYINLPVTFNSTNRVMNACKIPRSRRRAQFRKGTGQRWLGEGRVRRRPGDFRRHPVSDMFLFMPQGRFERSKGGSGSRCRSSVGHRRFRGHDGADRTAPTSLRRHHELHELRRKKAFVFRADLAPSVLRSTGSRLPS
jgi:hypothetical protein